MAVPDDRGERQSSGMSRRGFLKRAAATATLAAPYVVPASVFGANAPSNRVNVACIGVGNQGYFNLPKFLSQSLCQIVAVCDVNRGSAGYKEPGDVRGREPAKQLVEEHYAKQTGAGQYKGCDTYNDFREVLARDDVDAVMIAAPDHWHEPMTIASAEAGKDIYCEKPLGLTIAGQQRMIAAVRKHQRILQAGTHERSNPIVRKACELVRSGAIGEVKRVVAHVGRHNKVGPGPGWKPMPVPDGFDYALWLGPAPDAPYHKDRCLYNFRFIYDYAGGQVTNFGAHSLDMAQWGLGMDGTGPVSIEHVYADYLPKGSLFNAATHTSFRCRYANGAVVECFTAEPSVRCIFEGSEGMVRVDNMGQSFFATPASIWPEGIKGNEKYHSGEDHIRNFLECVKSRSEPAAPVEVTHRSASLCHLGNITIKLQAKLRWDPKQEKFVGSGSEEANALLDRQARDSWTTQPLEQSTMSRGLLVRFSPIALIVIGLGTGVLPADASLSAEPAAMAPNTVYWDGVHLASLRASLSQDDPRYREVLKRLRKNAEISAKRGPYSVMDKEDVAPSGDKHDYLSYARYWWPNPDTKDGLPYVRRDGRTNEGLLARGDRVPIGKLYDDVETLALAGYLFNEDRYAEHAAKLVRTWFLDPATKMNPHLRYGQAVPGKNEGRGAGIIDTRHFIRVLDSVALLQQTDAWSEEDHAALVAWMKEYLTWLQNDPMGKDEASEKNNHGTWYDAQVAAIAMFVGEQALARQIVENTKTTRIAACIEPDGQQPEELGRSKGMHYSIFNMSAMSVLARIGEQLTVDVWSYESEDGRSLRGGLDFVMPYLSGEKEWPHEQIDELDVSPSDMGLFYLAAARYEEPKYLRVLDKYRDPPAKFDYARLQFAAK